MYLPPYSPDLNPIEPAFSKIKAYIRRHGEEYRNVVDLLDDGEAAKAFLCKAVLSVSESDAFGWFEHSGYISGDTDSDNSSE